jgi:hypothetical protein
MLGRPSIRPKYVARSPYVMPYGRRGPEVHARQARNRTESDADHLGRAAGEERRWGLPRATEPGCSVAVQCLAQGVNFKAGRSILGGVHEAQCVTQPRPLTQQLAASAHGQSLETSLVSAPNNTPFRIPLPSAYKLSLVALAGATGARGPRAGGAPVMKLRR